MEYFGPERIFASDVREGMLVFSDKFKFGNTAPAGADYTVEIVADGASKERCTAYDFTRVIASYRVEKITVCNFKREPRTGKPAFGDHAQVIAVRLDASGNATKERILFRLASFVTFCLEHVHGGQPSGAYMSEHGGLCLRGDLAWQEERLSYFRRVYAEDDRGGETRVIVERRRALKVVRRLHERVKAFIDAEKDKAEYAELRRVMSADDFTAYLASRAAEKGMVINRMIARESATAPIEQFVNIVPTALERVGRSWKITCFTGTCTSFWHVDDRTAIWWSKKPFEDARGTSIVFLAVNKSLVEEKEPTVCAK